MEDCYRYNNGEYVILGNEVYGRIYCIFSFVLHKKLLILLRSFSLETMNSIYFTRPA